MGLVACLNGPRSVGLEAQAGHTLMGKKRETHATCTSFLKNGARAHNLGVRAHRLGVLPDGLDGHDLVLEAAAAAGCSCAFVAARRQLILVLARDPVLLRHILRRHACAHSTINTPPNLHSTIARAPHRCTLQCAIIIQASRHRHGSRLALTHGQEAVLGLLVFSDLRVDTTVPGHGVGAHGLHAAGQADLVVARLDGSRHAGDGLQARRTLPAQ